MRNVQRPDPVQPAGPTIAQAPGRKGSACCTLPWFGCSVGLSGAERAGATCNRLTPVGRAPSDLGAQGIEVSDLQFSGNPAEGCRGFPSPRRGDRDLLAGRLTQPRPLGEVLVLRHQHKVGTKR
jgi:hypothetical protein